MARYINLDELLTAIDKRNGRLPLWLDEILMEDCKIADVTPVRHGRWINENFYTRCSVCENMAIYDKYGQEVESDYCPNCGARMDGDADANGNDNKTPET